MAKRTHVLTVRLTPAEYQIVKRGVKQTGWSFSHYVRMCINFPVFKIQNPAHVFPQAPQDVSRLPAPEATPK